MQVLDEYKNARKLLHEQKFQEAFDAFKKIAFDESKDKVARVNAFNMLYISIMISPGLDEDESGLTYLKKALKINPDDFSTLSNIVGSFGPLPCDHQDIELFKMGAHRLLTEEKFRSQLLEKEKEMIMKKYDLIEEIKNNPLV